MENNAREALFDDEPPRRGFMAAAARGVMLGGLFAGYGTLGGMAGRFLFPSQRDFGWLFVSDAQGIAPGESREFESPIGIKLTIKRAADASGEPRVEQFIALSSVCPHLGCRVHWESNNHRFFCPCHNGEFDPSGTPIGGPVLAANQHLPRYPLKIEQGLLFIELPTQSVGGPRERRV